MPVFFLSLIGFPLFSGRHYLYILAFRLTRSTDLNAWYFMLAARESRKALFRETLDSGNDEAKLGMNNSWIFRRNVRILLRKKP